jgi:hypothetical protein
VATDDFRVVINTLGGSIETNVDPEVARLMSLGLRDVVPEIHLDPDDRFELQTSVQMWYAHLVQNGIALTVLDTEGRTWVVPVRSVVSVAVTDPAADKAHHQSPAVAGAQIRKTIGFLRRPRET